MDNGITPLSSQCNRIRIRNVSKNLASILMAIKRSRSPLQAHHLITAPYEFAGHSAKKQTASARD
jgi:hypothetical protein